MDIMVRNSQVKISFIEDHAVYYAAVFRKVFIDTDYFEGISCHFARQGFSYRVIIPEDQLCTTL